MGQNELMDSKLRCVFALKEEVTEAKFETNSVPASIPSQPPPVVKVEQSGELNSSADAEIKKLNSQMSQLRQENLALKEETLRLKRIAAASEKPNDTPSYSSTIMILSEKMIFIILESVNRPHLLHHLVSGRFSTKFYEAKMLFCYMRC